MTFPEPPWTQAPSEVIAWRASTGGRSPPASRSHRPIRIRAFAVDLAAAEESRLLTRLRQLDLGRLKDGRVHRPHVITRLAHRAAPEVFVGSLGGLRVRVHVRKASRLEVRVAFTPAATFRKAWSIVSRLGLRPTEGTWV